LSLIFVDVPHENLIDAAQQRTRRRHSVKFVTISERTDTPKNSFSERTVNIIHFFLPDCLHGLLPGPFLLSYSVFVFSVFLIFRFYAVCEIKLAISSAFERTLVYRRPIVSYRIV